MRIGGKLHDYYDRAMAYGIDETLYFHRETKPGPIEMAEKMVAAVQDAMGVQRYFRSYNSRFRITPAHVDLIVIGFCGKLYPAMKFEISPTSSFADGHTAHEEYYYTDHDFEKFYAFLKKPEFKRVGDLIDPLTVSKMRRFIEVLSNLPHSDAEFIEHRVPYFKVEFDVGQARTVDLCPRLADSQFYKAKDPFTAFQEISMYLGGVIPRQVPEMIQISDKDRIAQHGFNKQSFRHPFK